MHTEPKIVLSEDLSKRGYVIYYYNGIRQREYNGKRLKLKINPNYCSTYTERLKLHKKLLYQFTKALEAGWNPLLMHKTEPVLAMKPPSLQDALTAILKEKLDSALSLTYKRDLQKVVEQLMEFVAPNILEAPADRLDGRVVEQFLNQFNTSATYYMNKRRNLGVFFAELHRTKLISENLVSGSLRKKQTSHLHKSYTQPQMLAILDFLQQHYPNLHLCCLLAYGCFLRPHQEIRLLTANDVNEACTTLSLSGEATKNRRIRVVNVPLYVQMELTKRLPDLSPGDNILSGRKQAFNVCYLNTMWSRAKTKMLKLNLIQEDQTIYSFRHTAAVNVYRKTKDLNILKSLLGHSNMIVTLKYLRSLGEVDLEELRSAAPEL